MVVSHQLQIIQVVLEVQEVEGMLMVEAHLRVVEQEMILQLVRHKEKMVEMVLDVQAQLQTRMKRQVLVVELQ